jgi:putative membrane protein
MLSLRPAALAFGTWLIAGPALAHSTDSPHAEPGWTLQPWLLILLGGSLILYAWGWFRLHGKAGRGRSVLIRRSALFAAGWVALFIAAVSPLHEAGDRSFALHMVEHELLMLVAAPLLVAARPIGPMLWGLPRSIRSLFKMAGRSFLRPLYGFWTRPVSATLLQIAALWIWHMPALFDRALDHEGWHVTQHLSFLISALLFWQAMLAPAGRSLFVRVGCLFLTSTIAGALGALMAFAQGPWYARYAELGMTPFDLTPIEDQQLAGLLMWIPGGLVHVGAALFLIGKALEPAGPSRPADRASRDAPTLIPGD